MRPVDVNGVKVGTYIDFRIENDDKDPKFKFGNHVKISKKQNYFCNRLRSKLVGRSFSN